jgi:alpha-tubulin suppressor-like RCC1 family protein
MDSPFGMDASVDQTAEDSAKAPCICAAALPPPAVRVDSVALGGWHSCAITDAGRLLCWGTNDRLQLGDGSEWEPNLFRVTPSTVPGMESHVAEVAAGDEHTCARKHDGSVWCWGGNWLGQAGDATEFQLPLPLRVQGIDDAVRIAAGSIHTCAVRSDRSLWCWGAYYVPPPEMIDERVETATPTLIEALGHEVLDVTAGVAHTCVRKTDGRVWCWGSNQLGQLGSGTQGIVATLTPIEVEGLGGSAIAVSAGLFHTCALMPNRSVRCWGADGSGQLGRGSQSEEPRPDPAAVVSASAPFSQIATGVGHTCALTVLNDAWCWGWNAHGEVGDGEPISWQPYETTPVRVCPLCDLKQVAAGGTHSCAVQQDGHLWCWGNNGKGQLGVANLDPSATPQLVVFEPE